MYSRASAVLPVNALCTNRENGSTPSRIFIHPGFAESPSQPLSKRAPRLPPTRARKRRRPSRLGSDMSSSNVIPADDHRADVVPEARDQNHQEMNQYEPEKRERANEMERARRLAPPEDPEQPRITGDEMRRHGESRKDNKRAKHAQDDEVSQLLQHIVMFRVLPFRKTQLHMLPDRMADLP